MLSTLKEAFPKHTSEDFHAIYRLLDVYCEEENRTPTLREIKLLANQVGALHRQHGDSIPIAHMAYYVLLTRKKSDKRIRKNNDKDILKKLLSREIPEEGVTGLVGNDVGDSIAALIYGVESGQARQLLLQPSILNALSNAGGEQLKDLECVSGFLDVLEQAVTHASVDWPKAEGEKILHAVVALHEIAFVDSSENFRLGLLFNRLALAASRIEKINPLNETTDRGFFLLVTKAQDQGLAQYLFEAYARAIKGGSIPATQKDISSLAIRMAGLAGQLHIAGFVWAYKAGIELPCDMNTFFASVGSVAKEASEDQVRFLKILRPNVPAEQAVKSVQEIVSSGKFHDEHSAAIPILMEHIGKDLWKTVVEAIRTRLNGNNNIQPVEANPLLAALVDLCDVSEGEIALRTLVTEGSIAHHIWTAVSGKNTEMMARCLFIYMRVMPTLAPQNQVNQSGNGYQQLKQWQSTPVKGLPEELAKLLIHYKQEEFLFTVLEKTPGASNLVGETLAAVNSSDLGREFLTPQLILQRWSFIERHLDPDALAKRFAVDGRLTAQSVQDGFQRERTRLYEAIVESCPEDTKFINWCAEELRKIERDTWVVEIQSDDGGLISLALECTKKGVHLDLRQPFLDALYAHASKSVKNEVGKPPKADEWPTLLEILHPSERDFLRSQLYELLKGSAGQAGESFFQIYGNAISPGHLRQDSSLVIKVLKPMLDNRNAQGLRWVCEKFTQDPQLLDGSKVEHKEVFIHALEEEYGGGKSDDAHKYILEIAGILKVQPPEPRVGEDSPPESMKPA
jgi:hypothetical protein